MRRLLMLGLMAGGLAGCTVGSTTADSSKPQPPDMMTQAACNACPYPCDGDKSTTQWCRGWYDDMRGSE